MKEYSLTFSKSVKKEILEAFNKTVDKEGMIVEKDNLQQKVLSSDGQELSLNEFGGIKKGSEVYINNNIVSLIKLTKKD
jgi:hypothetical protein